MSKNKLADLNNHLFCQLERINNDDLKGEELKEEISKAEAMARLSEQIINNKNLVLKAFIAFENAHIDLPEAKKLIE